MITGKQYAEGEAKATPIENCRAYMYWVFPKGHPTKDCSLMLLTDDNRKSFRHLFGKPNFYFKSEFYFHVWEREFNGHTFLLLTAKDKGTCIEMVGETAKTIREKGEVVVAFVTELSNQLRSYHDTIRTRQGNGETRKTRKP